MPGCVPVGDTLDEVKAEIREAIAFHLEGMKEDGLPIPAPESCAEYVGVGVNTNSLIVGLCGVVEFENTNRQFGILNTFLLTHLVFVPQNLGV